MDNKIRGFEVVPNKHREHPYATIITPERATQNAAGYDIYSPVNVTVPAHGTAKIFTDVCAYMQPNEVLMIYTRSSYGKIPMRLCNGTGVLDADYYGNISNGGNMIVMLQNMSDNDVDISAGDRIAQCMFINYLVADNGNTDAIRTGGVGSTGV